MSIPEDHKYYLEKDTFWPKCNREIFSDDELSIIKEYGHWLSALAEGKIQPYTKAQKRFLEVHKRRLDPKTDYEKTWIKYQKRLKIENDYQNVPTYKLDDPGESWFSRKDTGRMSPYGGFKRKK
jgi:uncharacterized protein YifE (UPF0438 family)